MNLAGLPRWWSTPTVDGPDLRVVEERTSARPAATMLAALGLSILFIVLFGLAVFHTVLISAQSRLDRLDQRIAAEEARRDELRLEVAELESPVRIVETARDELGMVTPPEVVWLTPDGPRTVPAPVPDPADPADPADPELGTDPGELAGPVAEPGDGQVDGPGEGTGR